MGIPHTMLCIFCIHVWICFISIIRMRIYKSIKDGKVSTHAKLRNAIASRPDVVFATKGLIVPTH